MNIYIKPAELVGAEIGDEIAYHDFFGIVQTAMIVSIDGNQSLRVKRSDGYLLTIPLHRLVNVTKEFKVGDRVEGDDYEHLPVGTILRELNGLYVWYKNMHGDWGVTGSEWSSTNSKMSQATYPREIVYLP